MRWIGVIAAAGLFAGSSPAGATIPVFDLLRDVGGFSATQLAAVERGEATARVLGTDRREIAVMGAVRIRGSRERLIARYRDVSNLQRSDLVLQVGVFSRTPSPNDLAALVPDPYDLDAPRSCVPGDCGVRLSTGGIARFKGAVNWSGPAARQQSAREWRFILADIARAYATGGDGQLPEYANKKEPLPVRAEMGAVYGGFEFLSRAAPEFFRYVREYPHARLDGVEDVLYWTVTDFGIRPVIGITHQAIYARAGGPTVITLKRLYAAHYLDAGLGVTLAGDDGSGGFYLVMLERIRTRSLTSVTRSVVRSIVQGRSRDGIVKALDSTKRALENP